VYRGAALGSCSHWHVMRHIRPGRRCEMLGFCRAQPFPMQAPCLARKSCARGTDGDVDAGCRSASAVHDVLSEPAPRVRPAAALLQAVPVSDTSLCDARPTLPCEPDLRWPAGAADTPHHILQCSQISSCWAHSYRRGGWRQDAVAVGTVIESTVSELFASWFPDAPRCHGRCIGLRPRHARLAVTQVAHPLTHLAQLNKPVTGQSGTPSMLRSSISSSSISTLLMLKPRREDRAVWCGSSVADATRLCWSF